MKLCIVGAGAMGCLIGGLVQATGKHEVSFVARGSQLNALREKGLTLEAEGKHWHGAVNATDDATMLGPQDAVFMCTKSYQLGEASKQLAPLLGKETMVVPAVNGMPWWYFYNHGGKFDGRSFTSLDPDGALAAHVPNERIIGCVNYLGGSITQPGTVHYVAEIARRLTIGEPSGAMTPRLEQLAQMLRDAGFEPTVTDNIRGAVWHKLLGNIAFNPISALTNGTIDQIAEGYRDIDLVSAVMNEARFVADKLGIELAQTTASRVQAAAKMRGHKTSMLQDMEAGRATEIEAIVGVVREIGKWLEVGTPYLNTLYSLVKLKEIFYQPSA